MPGAAQPRYVACVMIQMGNVLRRLLSDLMVVLSCGTTWEAVEPVECEVCPVLEGIPACGCPFSAS